MANINFLIAHMNYKFAIVSFVVFFSFLVGHSLEFNYQGLKFSVIEEEPTECTVMGFQKGVLLEELVIPEVAKNGEDEYAVTAISEWAFYNCESIKSVVIGNTITHIYGYAFSNCPNIKSVELGETLKYIGVCAFAYCEGLTEITIPESIEKIGYLAFDETSIKTVYFNAKNCSSLYEYDRTFPLGLTSVVCGENVEIIPDNAFHFCVSLNSVTFTNSVKRIGNNAFEGCAFVNVTLPNSLTSIGDMAFSMCNNLSSINIPNSVSKIGFGAFSNTGGLKSVKLPSELNVVANQLFSHSSIESVIIPERVDSIGSYAFSYCPNLTTVDIPNSVKCIGDEAFAFDYAIKSIVLPEVVDNFGVAIFDRCTSLETIKLPSNITTLPYGTFYGCSSLTSIDLPSSIVNIEVEAFRNCELLEFVGFPEKLESIEDDAFWGCTSLKELDFPSSLRTLGDYAFSTGYFAEYPDLTIESVKFNGPVETIGKYTFCNCAYIRDVDIWDVESWAKIDMYNWESNPICYSGKFTVKSKDVRHILITQDVERVKPYTFYSSWNIKTARIESPVIGKSSFENTTLTDLCINAIEIESEAFNACSSLQNIYSLTPNPPKASDDVFYTFSSETSQDPWVYEHATLYVPFGCMDAYRNSQYCWRLFANIIETDFEGVDEKFAPDHETSGIPSLIYKSQDSLGEEKLYNLNGIEVSGAVEALSPGIYISVKGGERKKIVIH